ncbi:MAG: hypothetical protein QOJ67_3434 [Acidimicrobiaceae bacterium]
MRRGVVIVVIAAVSVLSGAGCGDDKQPPARSSTVSEASGFSQIAPPRSPSPEEKGTARQLAVALVDGIAQSSAGAVSSTDAACLVDELVATVSASALARISAGGPDPRSLPAALRTVMVAAFNRCLPADVAKRLASRFDATAGG